jgi:hypothetical protein
MQQRQSKKHTRPAVGATKGSVVCGGYAAPNGDGPTPFAYERVADGMGNPMVETVLGVDGVVNVVGVVNTDGGGGSRDVAPIPAAPAVTGRPVATGGGLVSNSSNTAAISSSSISIVMRSDKMTQNQKQQCKCYATSIDSKPTCYLYLIVGQGLCREVVSLSWEQSEYHATEHRVHDTSSTSRLCRFQQIA